MGNGTSPSTYNHSVLTEYQESSESCRQRVLREEENLAHEHYCKLKINNESNTHFKLGVMTHARNPSTRRQRQRGLLDSET